MPLCLILKQCLMWRVFKNTKKKIKKKYCMDVLCMRYALHLNDINIKIIAVSLQDYAFQWKRRGSFKRLWLALSMSAFLKKKLVIICDSRCQNVHYTEIRYLICFKGIAIQFRSHTSMFKINNINDLYFSVKPYSKFLL